MLRCWRSVVVVFIESEILILSLLLPRRCGQNCACGVAMRRRQRISGVNAIPTQRKHRTGTRGDGYCGEGRRPRDRVYRSCYRRCTDVYSVRLPRTSRTPAHHGGCLGVPPAAGHVSEPQDGISARWHAPSPLRGRGERKSGSRYVDRRGARGRAWKGKEDAVPARSG